jgi:hypothetical protein
MSKIEWTHAGGGRWVATVTRDGEAEEKLEELRRGLANMKGCDPADCPACDQGDVESCLRAADYCLRYVR